MTYPPLKDSQNSVYSPPSPQSGQINFYTPKIHHFGLEEVVVLSDFMGDSFIDASAKEDVGAVVVGKGWIFCCCL